jgi:hypothetical protein
MHWRESWAFEDVESLYREGDRIAERLRGGGALSATDLARALIANADGASGVYECVEA